MTFGKAFWRRFAACSATAAWAVLPASSGGFSVFGQGTKAAGLADTFVARADDGSAVYYNPAGLANQTERAFLVGITVMDSGDTTFSGDLPFPGPTQSGASDSHLNSPIHVYWGRPSGCAFTLAVGPYTPFYQKLDWRDPSEFSGRYISTFSRFTTLDLSGDIAWRATDRLSIGGGLILRFSTLDWQKRLPVFEPFLGSVVDFATSELESDTDLGFTIDFGLMYRINDVVTWGLVYRGPIGLEYDVDTKLVQIPTGNSILDDVQASMFPLGKTSRGTSEIEFPQSISTGVALAVGPRVSAEIDVVWTDWSTFTGLEVEYRNASILDVDIPIDNEASYSYRLGVIYLDSVQGEWRFGYSYEESPLDERTASPLYVDASTNVFAVGYGRPVGPVTIDVAVQLHDISETTVAGESALGFFGTYETDRWLFSAAVGF